MLVNVHEAINIISNINPHLKFEILPIENAIDRVCAEDILAFNSLPRFDHSAMDGYAINYEDRNNELKNIDTIFAGDNKNTLLEKDTCIKIMTGARVPANTTAVVPKEDVQELDNNKIKINENVKKLQHIRFIGEDIKADETIIQKGEVINFAKITMLVSQGISHIKVYKKPKIVVFSSGEELKLHYEKIEDHQIYNSNTPTFIARAKELGCDVTFIGQAKDSIKAIQELISNSLDADLLITSGGVSVGDADFTRESFSDFNFETLFDGIKIKPGKPTIFGKIKDSYILNLPGNPLASAMIFEMFGKIIIQKLIGSKEIFPNIIETKISEDLKIKKGRITLVPGTFNGNSFTPSQKRSPGMVSVLSNCNSFISLNDDVELIKKDNIVKVLPINWKFFSKNEKDFLTYE